MTDDTGKKPPNARPLRTATHNAGKPSNPHELSPVETAAIAEFMTNGGNMSAALRKVHPNAKNWNENTLNVSASATFAQTKVRIRIAQLRAEQQQRTAITADRVLQEAYKLAFSDVRQLFREDGELKSPAEWPDGAAGAIASFEVVTQNQGVGQPPRYIHKVKLWDKNPALEKLFRHMGLFERDNNQKANILAQDLSTMPLPLLQMIQDKIRAYDVDGAASRGSLPDVSGNGSASGDRINH